MLTNSIEKLDQESISKILGLSEEVYEQTIKSNIKDHIDVITPNWDEYLMGISLLISMRSKDSDTKHGCVIVNQKNRICATGYNSFPNGMTDEQLPNTRPNKYSYMIHAESNAIKNKTIHDLSGCRAYITGLPCLSCLMELYQASIFDIITLNNKCCLFNGYTNQEKFLYLTISNKMNFKVLTSESMSNIKHLLISALESKHFKT